MTRAEIEKILTNLTDTTLYLRETTRRLKEAAEHIRAGVGAEDDQTGTSLKKLIQADIEGLREARRQPAARTHIDLNEAVARLERVVLELTDYIHRNKDQS